MTDLLERPGTEAAIPATPPPAGQQPHPAAPYPAAPYPAAPHPTAPHPAGGPVATVHLLPGGAAAELRAAGPDDEEPVLRFLGGLSMDSAYRRFFAGIGPHPVSLARHLVQALPGRAAVLALADREVIGVADTALVDGGRAVELGVVLADREVIGVADTALVDGGRAVELGVVLADRWQRRGLGWPLCRAALEPALALGARTLVAHTLPDNARVARMLRRQWPEGAPRLHDGTYVWTLPLTLALTGPPTGPLTGMTGPVARER